VIDQRIVLVGRHDRRIRRNVLRLRGPAQAKFTAKELAEFGELQHCQAVVQLQELALNRPSEIELADRTKAGASKVYELFREFAGRSQSAGAGKRVHFTFLKSPVALIGTDRVEAVRLELNKLTGDAFRQSARGTGKIVELEAGAVFRSIGYRGVPVPGIPFDPARGVIPNAGGRIIDEHGRPVPGLYVTGWIKRGPTGIIGTNRADSVATVNALLDDLAALPAAGRKSGARATTALLREAGIRFVSHSDWLTIDRSEIARGARRGKPREKFIRTEEMLGLLD
jgi:ferredoxin--NADP+ reductase